MKEMFLVLLRISVLFCTCIDLLVRCTWSEEAHYYTIYRGDYTWNNAREACRNDGDKLLMIQNETEWTMWIELLNTSYSREHRSSDGIYWFGLHAPDTGSPTNYYWDDCTAPEYMEPAVDDYPVTDYVCVTMWIRREVFNFAFMDMWLKGRMCNETHSFICMNNNADCFPTCEEMIINTDMVTCDILCDGTICRSTYFQQLNLCHVMPTTYSNPNKFHLCHLPSADYIPTTCAEPTDVLTDSSTDVNMNVTDTVCIDFHTNTTSNTTNPDECTCLCRQLWTFLAQVPPEEANLTIEEKVEKIVEELTVDKKNTTVTLRKYVSVMDDRPSSVGIGIVASIIIFTVVGIIILIDLATIWHEIHHVLLKVFKFLRPNRIMHHDPVGELAEAIGAVPFALATGGRFKKFPGNNITSNPPFVMTAGGRLKAIPKPDTIETKQAFVWTAGGRIKAFTSNPPKLEKKNANFQQTNGLGWLMRERHIYNDVELPAYPNNTFRAKASPGTPPVSTRL